jgi:hypothetical protein
MADITGTRAVTNSVLSPNIEMMIGQWTIGYVRRLTETQARPVTPIYEIGTVGVVELTPQQPAPITLAAEKIEIYGATFINVVAKSIASGDLAGVSPAPGLSLDDTKNALRIWLRKRLGNEDMGQIFTLNDFPVGFQFRVTEQHPLDDTKQLITTYQNSWITRYTRPIMSTGELLVVATADITAARAVYTEGIPVTQDKVEVVARN